MIWGTWVRYNRTKPHVDQGKAQGGRRSRRDPRNMPDWFLVAAWVDGWIIREFAQQYGQVGATVLEAKWAWSWEDVVLCKYAYRDKKGETDWICTDRDDPMPEGLTGDVVDTQTKRVWGEARILAANGRWRRLDELERRLLPKGVDELAAAISGLSMGDLRRLLENSEAA